MTIKLTDVKAIISQLLSDIVRAVNHVAHILSAELFKFNQRKQQTNLLMHLRMTKKGRIDHCFHLIMQIFLIRHNQTGCRPRESLMRAAEHYDILHRLERIVAHASCNQSHQLATIPEQHTVGSINIFNSKWLNEVRWSKQYIADTLFLHLSIQLIVVQIILTKIIWSWNSFNT